MMDNRANRNDTNDFYELIQEFYGKGEGDEKHKSPTKRLISLKNSTSDHKQLMKSNIQR